MWGMGRGGDTVYQPTSRTITSDQRGDIALHAAASPSEDSNTRVGDVESGLSQGER